VLSPLPLAPVPAAAIPVPYPVLWALVFAVDLNGARGRLTAVLGLHCTAGLGQAGALRAARVSGPCPACPGHKIDQNSTPPRHDLVAWDPPRPPMGSAATWAARSVVGGSFWTCLDRHRADATPSSLHHRIGE